MHHATEHVCVYGQGLSPPSPLPAVPGACAAIAVLGWMQGETAFHPNVQFGLGWSNTQLVAVVMLWEVDLISLYETIVKSLPWYSQ